MTFDEFYKKEMEERENNPPGELVRYSLERAYNEGLSTGFHTALGIVDEIDLKDRYTEGLLEGARMVAMFPDKRVFKKPDDPIRGLKSANALQMEYNESGIIED